MEEYLRTGKSLKRPGQLSSHSVFSQASTIMGKASTMNDSSTKAGYSLGC